MGFATTAVVGISTAAPRAPADRTTDAAARFAAADVRACQNASLRRHVSPRYAVCVTPWEDNMAFSGLFGSGVQKHPNLDHIVQALHDHLGLQLAVPTQDVLNVIDQMTQRELLQFDNLHSVEGMQELFRARSIRAMLDPATHTVALTLAPAEELEEALKAEHAQKKVL